MSDKAIAAAAQALLDARVSASRLEVAQHPWAPATEADAYAVQAVVTEGTGPVGGWKIGAPAPDGNASFAPLPEAGVYPSGTALADGEHRIHGIEVEIAFRLRADLPTRDAPYSRDEVAAAIEAAVPIIEVVETRLSDRDAANGMWALADFLSHGELVVGDPVTNWQEVEMNEVAVTLNFDDKIIVDRPCRNAGGQPLDLVVRLADICNSHCGGLKAGQVVTTGSLMGLELAWPGVHVSTSIAGVGDVNLRFIA